MLQSAIAVRSREHQHLRCLKKPGKFNTCCEPCDRQFPAMHLTFEVYSEQQCPDVNDLGTSCWGCFSSCAFHDHLQYIIFKSSSDHSYLHILIRLC